MIPFLRVAAPSLMGMGAVLLITAGVLAITK
jgi:hypothetical protein